MYQAAETARRLVEAEAPVRVRLEQPARHRRRRVGQLLLPLRRVAAHVPLDQSVEVRHLVGDHRVLEAKLRRIMRADGAQLRRGAGGRRGGGGDGVGRRVDRALRLGREAQRAPVGVGLRLERKRLRARHDGPPLADPRARAVGVLAARLVVLHEVTQALLVLAVWVDV